MEYQNIDIETKSSTGGEFTAVRGGRDEVQKRLVDTAIVFHNRGMAEDSRHGGK